MAEGPRRVPATASRLSLLPGTGNRRRPYQADRGAPRAAPGLGQPAQHEQAAPRRAYGAHARLGKGKTPWVKTSGGNNFSFQ